MNEVGMLETSPQKNGKNWGKEGEKKTNCSLEKAFFFNKTLYSQLIESELLILIL